MNDEGIKKRYQLRYAAGQYWLLDMKQKGVPYRSPLSVNEAGALIWNRLLEGWTLEMISDELSREYSISTDEVRTDVLQFIEQLTAYGVLLEE